MRPEAATCLNAGLILTALAALLALALGPTSPPAMVAFMLGWLACVATLPADFPEVVTGHGPSDERDGRRADDHAEACPANDSRLPDQENPPMNPNDPLPPVGDTTAPDVQTPVPASGWLTPEHFQMVLKQGIALAVALGLLNTADADSLTSQLSACIGALFVFAINAVLVVQFLKHQYDLKTGGSSDPAPDNATPAPPAGPTAALVLAALTSLALFAGPALGQGASPPLRTVGPPPKTLAPALQIADFYRVPLLLCFSQVDCPPCREQEKVLDGMRAAGKLNSVVCFKVDARKHKDIADWLGIRGVPHIVLLRSTAELQASFAEPGVQPEGEIIKLIGTRVEIRSVSADDLQSRIDALRARQFAGAPAQATPAPPSPSGRPPRVDEGRVPTPQEADALLAGKDVVNPDCCGCGPGCQCAPCGPGCPCCPWCSLLPWRRSMEKRLKQSQSDLSAAKERIASLEGAQRQAPAPIAPPLQQQAPAAPQIIILPGGPLQALPIAGAPLQQLPIQGQPLQPLPIQGQPLQPLPIQGAPQQQLPQQGQPQQQLPIAGPQQAPQTLPQAQPIPQQPQGPAVPPPQRQAPQPYVMPSPQYQQPGYPQQAPQFVPGQLQQLTGKTFAIAEPK